MTWNPGAASERLQGGGCHILEELLANDWKHLEGMSSHVAVANKEQHACVMRTKMSWWEDGPATGCGSQESRWHQQRCGDPQPAHGTVANGHQPAPFHKRCGSCKQLCEWYSNAGPVCQRNINSMQQVELLQELEQVST